MSMKVAIKPKYPTRKAIDKVIFNDGDFIDIIDVAVPEKITDLLDTSRVSFIVEDKFYEVDVENYEEQFRLVEAGETPTVEPAENFGIKKLGSFISVPDPNYDSIQNIEIYNGIISGELYKVMNYSSLGIAEITSNGYWIAFNFDLVGATAVGYSVIKYDEQELVDGKNFVFLGENSDIVNRSVMKLTAKLTVGELEDSVEFVFDKKFNCSSIGEELFASGVTLDGVEYDTLALALAALGTKNGTIEVGKYQVMSDSFEIKDGQTVIINLKNGATIDFQYKKSFIVSYGSLYFNGNGTVSDKNNSYSALKFINDNTSRSAYAYIGEGVTISGAYGILVSKNVVNTIINIEGNVIGINDSWGGTSVYVNGNALDVTINISGNAVVSAGCMGAYLAGNNITTISGNAKVYGKSAGVEIRAGKLTVSGNANVSCDKDTELKMTPSGNGSATTGGAIGIAQHTSKLPIEVSVLSGTVSGNAGIYEGNPQENPAATEDTKITVSGGTIMGATASVLTVAADTDCTKFLTGGKYNIKPDDIYIDNKYYAEATISGAYDIKKKGDDYAPIEEEVNSSESIEEQTAVETSVQEEISSSESKEN